MYAWSEPHNLNHFKHLRAWSSYENDAQNSSANRTWRLQNLCMAVTPFPSQTQRKKLSVKKWYQEVSEIFLKNRHLKIVKGVKWRRVFVLLVACACTRREDIEIFIDLPMLATSLPVAHWLERPTGSIPEFDSRRGLRFFLCPTLATCWIFHLFLFIDFVSNFHSAFLMIGFKPPSTT